MATEVGGNSFKFLGQPALRQAEQQIKVESLLDSISEESKYILEQQTNKPQLIGRTEKTAGMIMQEQQANLQAQTIARHVAASADWENLAVKQGQELAATMVAKDEITAKIVKDSSVSFWDDPLTAIANEFTLPWDQQKLSAIEEREATLKKTMDNIHNHVQQSATTAAVIKEAITAETLEEQSAALQSYQNQQASAAKINFARVGIDNLKAVREMDKDATDLYIKDIQMRNEAERMDMARKDQARRDEMWDAHTKEQKSKEQAEADYLQFANLALRSEGKKELTNINEFNKLKGMSAKYLDTLIRRGFAIYTADSNNTSYGASIETRLTTMDELGFRPRTKQQESILLAQDDAYKAVPKEITDPKERSKAANKSFNEDFVAGQQDVREGSAFAAPAFGVYATTEVANDPIWKKYVAPTLTETSKNGAVTPEFIQSVVAKAVRDGVPSSEASRFAAHIFKKAIALNNEVHQFEKIAGRKQEMYKVRMATRPGIVGFHKGMKTTDLTDPVAWNYLTAQGIVKEYLQEHPSAVVLE